MRGFSEGTLPTHPTAYVGSVYRYERHEAQDQVLRVRQARPRPRARPERPLPRRFGIKSPVNPTWIGRQVEVSYDAAGHTPAYAKGVLAGFGPWGVDQEGRRPAPNLLRADRHDRAGRRLTWRAREGEGLRSWPFAPR